MFSADARPKVKKIINITNTPVGTQFVYIKRIILYHKITGHRYHSHCTWPMHNHYVIHLITCHYPLAFIFKTYATTLKVVECDLYCELGALTMNRPGTFWKICDWYKWLMCVSSLINGRYSTVCVVNMNVLSGSWLCNSTQALLPM